MTVVVKWPELDASVRCMPSAQKPQAYQWLRDNSPMAAVQSHAVISGELMYALNLPIKNVPCFEYNELESTSLTTAPVGTCWIIFAYGRTAGFMMKWGEDITEDMAYPEVARVHSDDLDVLQRVGGKVWDSIYRSKKIIRTFIQRS